MTATVSPSFCRVCNFSCPILVHVEDGRVTRVTGDPLGPLHEGYSCHRGRALPEMTNSPDRLLHTMKRQPDGHHVALDVEDAMDEIAAQLRQIVDEHGPRSVALYVGTALGKSIPAYAISDSFIAAIGSPMRFSANTIDQPGKHIAKGLHGYWLAPPQAFDEPQVVLWIGLNPLITYTGMPSGHPRRFFEDLSQRGARIIVIDPRRTEVARRASIHLQPRPGYDVAIMAAMLRVIVRERLYDAAFVAENVDGVETLRAAVEPFTLDFVSDLADVPAADIELAARTFASAKRGYAVAGTGPNMGTAQGTLFEYLVLALDTICGHYLRAGERVRSPGTLSRTPTFKAQAAPPVQAFGFGESMRSRGLTDTLAGMPVSALADEILTPGDGQVRALLVLGGNPVAAWPDQRKTIEAMRKLELLVTVDIRMSQTSRLAHYVIAPTTTLEVSAFRGDSPGGYAHGYRGYIDAIAQYTPAVVSRPEDADLIEDWELFYGLGKRLGLQLSLSSRQPYIASPAGGSSSPPTIDMDRKPTTDELIEVMCANARIPLEEVKQHPHGALFPPDPPVIVQPKDPGWSGRLDVGNELMMRDLALAFHAGDVAETMDGSREFRLVCRRMHQINSSLHIPAVDRGRPYNPAFMHPDDLQRLGLSDGDLVEIASAADSVRALVAADRSLRPGLVSMAHCFGGAPEEDDRVAVIGAPANRLLTVDGVADAYSGQPLMSNVPVDVRPYELSTPVRAKGQPAANQAEMRSATMIVGRFVFAEGMDGITEASAT